MILEIKFYKGATNCWLDPQGNLYECGYMNHNDWAYEWFENKYGKEEYLFKIDEIVGNIYNSYAYVALHKLGWWRILDWKTTTGIQLLNEYSDEISLNNYQKETLSYWCSLNNIDFEKFIS